MSPIATSTVSARAARALTAAAFEKSKYEVIIIGAGILGTALAATLSKRGRDVLLIERDWKEPDRIVGELLQPGGVQALKLLGLEDCLEGIDAVPCSGYAVFYEPEKVLVPYPADKTPNSGRSFHHGRFVMNLRRAARSAPNVTPVEGTASTLIHCPVTDQIIGCSYSYRNKDGATLSKNVYAPLTVVADGCFSKFRKQHITKDVTSASNFVGFVLKDCQLPHPNHGHVVLAKPSPVLLYQIGTHDTRILVDVPGKLPSISNGDLSTYLRTHIGPQLPSNVQPAFYEALKTERLRSMPNSWLPPSSNAKDGLMFLGDAMNMRHPLTGGGMTVALWDVVHVDRLLARSAVPDLADTALVMRRVGELHWNRKPLSSVVNILAQALYSLFSAGDDPHMKSLQMACFAYFKLGGRCVSTPAGLLAGLIPEPLTLVGHFFAVAFYGVYLICTGRLETSPSKDHSTTLLLNLPRNLWRSVMAIWTACVVVLPVIASELQK
ncbi:squalene epoxidase-domain-containing protein [Geranomyces variabilis]|nr:squalene epoxidase-domain-containing protein [Geranomyces variabilis]KAJ3134741.1 Squalene epoxidase [Geranomyces variabilis]